MEVGAQTNREWASGSAIPAARPQDPPEALVLPTAAPEAASTAGEALHQLVEAPRVLKLNLSTAPHELSQLLQQLPPQLALQLQAAQLLTQLPAHLCRAGGQLRPGLWAP